MTESQIDIQEEPTEDNATNDGTTSLYPGQITGLEGYRQTTHHTEGLGLERNLDVDFSDKEKDIAVTTGATTLSTLSIAEEDEITSISSMFTSKIQYGIQITESDQMRSSELTTKGIVDQQTNSTSRFTDNNNQEMTTGQDTHAMEAVLTTDPSVLSTEKEFNETIDFTTETSTAEYAISDEGALISGIETNTTRPSLRTQSVTTETSTTSEVISCYASTDCPINLPFCTSQGVCKSGCSGDQDCR